MDNILTGATEPATQDVSVDNPADTSTTDVSETGAVTGEGNQPGTDPAQATEPAQAIDYSEFTVPDGFEQPDESFIEVARTLGLNQDNAQALVNYYCEQLIPKLQNSAQAQVDKQLSGWEAQSRKEFSKDDLDIANKAFGSLMKEIPELHDVVRDSGMGVHPAFIKAMVLIGKKMSEGSVIGAGQVAKKEKSAAEILFPDI